MDLLPAIGLIFVLMVILINIDDLIYDLFYIFKKLIGKMKIESIDIKKIEAMKPKMLAIIVPAYHEESVLKSVIRNLILSNQYPRSMYRVFLGVYPNDPGTMKVAKELEEEFSNVHEVVHILNGPSSKADNLNNVIKNIYEYEKENCLKFAGIVVHDSEDLVHPYEFKFENYLSEKYPVIQMPVFPLQEKPKLSKIFKNMISGTYADEFSENHYRQLVIRNESKGFVPSAGTGFFIRRDVLEQFPDTNIFPVGSLTEDYKLSLQFKEMGFDVHYGLEKIQRMKTDGSIAKEYVSTRSMFPSTYRAAVRQKTRWIYGITVQSFKLKDVLKNKNLNFSSKHNLYKDWKAKIGNLLLGPGYIIFVYFLISLFYDVPIMYPEYTFAWYLMWMLSIIMIERQVLRFLAVKNVYGYKSALISTTLPPIIPFRMLVGNIINFHATFNALFLNKRKNKKKKNKGEFKWDKTKHDFLEEEILKRYRRNLGDTLLYKGLINQKNLKMALKLSKVNNQKLGHTLKRLNLVSEEYIVESICEITQKKYIKIHSGKFSDRCIQKYGEDILRKLQAIPLFETSKGMQVLTTLEAHEEDIKKVFKKENISFVYTTESSIDHILSNPNKDELAERKLEEIECYIEEGCINLEQGLLALRYNEQDASVKSTLQSMGLLMG